MGTTKEMGLGLCYQSLVEKKQVPNEGAMP